MVLFFSLFEKLETVLNCMGSIPVFSTTGETGCLKLGFDSSVAAVPCAETEQNVLQYRTTVTSMQR